jgi:hypothetical protein
MSKPLLRSTLKKLRALPLDETNHANVMMAPQEMLDCLALRSNMKSVWLLGRGFEDQEWIEGAAAMASKAGFHVVRGPLWDAKTDDETLPAWYREHLKAQKPAGEAVYICRTKAIADEVENSFRNPPITIEQEARLLGYPRCCVREHYERDSLLDHTFYKMLERQSMGDVQEMQRLLREDAEVSAQTVEEQEAIKKATEFTPAPYTSFHMCPACIAGTEQPGPKLSKRFEELAKSIDDTLSAEIARNQQGVGKVD